MRPDQAASIILRPYVTENTFDSIERENKLVFLVKDDATKQISVKTAFPSDEGDDSHDVSLFCYKITEDDFSKS